MFWFFILFFLSGCSQQDPISPTKIVEIAGRDDGFKKRPMIYQVKIPLHWMQKKLLPHEAVLDTTMPIAEFSIEEGDKKIRITIHNFPSETMSQRIPTLAQINRWKKQFQSLDLASVSIKSQAWGGFSGFLLEATGHLNEEKTSLLGWSLQLAAEHYLTLSYPPLRNLTEVYRQMRADVTIKAMGPQPLMSQHREAIVSFARSFRLIDDIP